MDLGECHFASAIETIVQIIRADTRSKRDWRKSLDRREAFERTSLIDDSSRRSILMTDGECPLPGAASRERKALLLIVDGKISPLRHRLTFKML